MAGAAWCAGPEWKRLDQNEDSLFYYDRSGPKRQGDATFKVRTRVVYTDTGKADAVKIMEGDKAFAKLFESRYVYEMDCKKERTRLLEASHLDESGVTIRTTDLSPSTEWEDTSPAARMYLVQEVVCK
jgi:hypothetical protein